MNPATQQPIRRRAFRLSKAALLGALLVTGGAVAAGWHYWPTPRHPLSTKEGSAPLLLPRAATDSAPTPLTGVTAVPRSLRPPLPHLPSVVTPEAKRMVTDMQNSYRCLHTTLPTGFGNCLPPNPDDATFSLTAFAATLHHTLGTLPDACYVTAALPQVTNPRTPNSLMDVFYEDLSRRPNPIRLRTLFVIAGMDAHPRAQTALSDLQTTMNADFQRDWPRWEQAITERLVREDRGLRGASCRAH